MTGTPPEAVEAISLSRASGFVIQRLSKDRKRRLFE